MPGSQQQISFTPLWQKLPRPPARIWRRTIGREILELLCSALWHLELAAAIGEGFPTATMQKLHRGAHVPWEEWLTQDPTLSVQSGECQLTIRYAFPLFFNVRYQSLLQTMSLANGALRLAGARDILRVTLRRAARHPQLPAVLEDYESILDSTGNFLTSPSLSQHKEQILRKVLIMVAFRDSIMHGETFSGRPDVCRKFRQLWIDGRLNRKQPKYSPAVIARACRCVWEKLVGSCVKFSSHL